MKSKTTCLVLLVLNCVTSFCLMAKYDCGHEDPPEPPTPCYEWAFNHDRSRVDLFNTYYDACKRDRGEAND